MEPRNTRKALSPRPLGAQRQDTALERLAFLIVQSPNGEFRRFLVLTVATVGILGAVLWLIFTLAPTWFAWLVASIIPTGAGVRSISRRVRNRRGQQ